MKHSFGRNNHLPIWSGSPDRWWIPFSSSCFTQWSSHLFRHYTGGFFLAIPIVDYDNPPICKGRLMAPNHQPSFINDILKMFVDSTPFFVLDGQTSIPPIAVIKRENRSQGWAIPLLPGQGAWASAAGNVQRLLGWTPVREASPARWVVWVHASSLAKTWKLME